MKEKENPEEYTFHLTEAEANFIVDCMNAVPLNGQQSLARIGLISKLNSQYNESKKEKDGKSD